MVDVFDGGASLGTQIAFVQGMGLLALDADQLAVSHFHFDAATVVAKNASAIDFFGVRIHFGHTSRTCRFFGQIQLELENSAFVAFDNWCLSNLFYVTVGLKRTSDIITSLFSGEFAAKKMIRVYIPGPGISLIIFPT